MNTPERQQEVIDAALGAAVSGRSAYHVRWNVRRYDLINLREDLDNVTEIGRGFAIWGSLLLGMGLSTCLSWLLVLNTKPAEPVWLRLTLGYGALIFVVLGAVVFALDKSFAQKARIDIAFVKQRVDNLISMFDQENKDGT